MKKVKRYNGEDDSAVEMDPEEEANKSAVAPSIEKSEELATPAYKSFKEAFAAERKAGSKTFEYMGKKYTTDLAPQTKAAKPTAPIPKPALRAETNDDRAKRFVEKRAAARAAASTAAAKPATAAKLSSSSRVPTSEQAAANRSAAMDKIKGMGSSIGDYFGSLDSTARYMKKKPGGLDQGSGGEYRRGGKVKKMASGGMTSSASKRADGCATKGKTKGRFV